MRNRTAPGRTFALLTFVLLLLGAPAAPATAQAPARIAPPLSMRSVFHDGERRIYGLYVPSTYAAGRPAPVIVVLHGRYSSAKAIHAFSGLASVAEARGALLVYPEPLGTYWSDGGHAALQRQDLEADDAGFIAAAVAAVGKDHAVDPARVFLVGHDTGGVMAWRAACRGPQRFAGMAVVSALMWNFSAEACGSGATPTPTFLIHGGRDESYPVEGALPQSGRTGRRMTLTATLDTLRTLNGCDGRETGAFVAACRSGAALAFLPVPRGANEWFHDGPGYQLSRHGVDSARTIDAFFFNREGFALPTVRSSGSGRGWITYVPASYDPAKPTPLVVLLHGRPSNATAMAVISRMNEVADEKGFIVVYPEGINNEWNAFYDLTRQQGGSNQDDIAFLKTLTEDLGRDLNIDRRRMFLGGFSNGGFMTIRMACSASDTFAGFASVGAELYTVLKDKCRGGRPAPILLMNGTADPSVNYNGIIVRSGADDQETRITVGARDTLAWFVKRNGCSQTGSTLTYPPRGQSPGTQAQRFTPNDCQAPVVFWLINGGGHTWPGTEGVMDAAFFGPTNMDIKASAEIWDFFSRLSLP